MKVVTVAKKKLLLSLSLVALPLILLSITGVFLAKDEITDQTLDGLETFATAQEARVEQLIDKYHTVHDGIASRTQFRASLDEFNASGSLTSVDAINRILSDARAPFSDIQGLLVLDSRANVVTDLESNIPTNMHRSFFEQGSNAFKIGQIDQENGQQIVHMGPIKRDSNLIGVLVIVFSADSLRSITHSTDGLGQTGETVIGYRIGNDAVLFPTRLQTSMDKIIVTQASQLPIIPTFGNQERIYSNATDYRGQKILAVTRYVESADWAIVAKRDQAEVFDSLATFMAIYIYLSVVILTLAVAAGFALLRPQE